MSKERRRKDPGKRYGKARKGRRLSLAWILVFITIPFIVLAGLGWIAQRPEAPSPKPAQPPGITLPPTTTSSPPPPPAAMVGIVDQFYSESPGFTDQALEFLGSRGISVKVHRDKDVTVGLYRRLPTYGYRLIILRVHAGVCERLKDHPTFLFTAEPYTTGKYTVEQLTNLVMSGVIDPDRPESPVFTVGPDFVRMSMEGDFGGASIVLSSCLGLYNQYLAEALIEKGGKVFVSWDEKVSLEHTDKAALLLLKALVEEGTTIREAVEKVMEEVGPDPIYGAVFKYYPPQAGGLRVMPRHAAAFFVVPTRVLAAMALIPAETVLGFAPLGYHGCDHKSSKS